MAQIRKKIPSMSVNRLVGMALWFALAFSRELQHPFQEVFHHTCVDRIPDKLPFLLRIYEACFSEQVEVVRDAGPGHLEALRNFPRVHIPFPEHLQDLPASRVVKRFEYLVHALFRQMSKYFLNFPNCGCDILPACFFYSRRRSSRATCKVENNLPVSENFDKSAKGCMPVLWAGENQTRSCNTRLVFYSLIISISMLKSKRLLCHCLFIVSLLLCTGPVFAQGRVIKGKIIDAGTGLPLNGVTVMAKATKAATTTDANGNFQLTVAGNSGILVFSYVGYENLEVPVGAKTFISLAMASSAKKLSDVVVVGYGSVRKSDVTGALASVIGDELMKTNPVNLQQGLQGRVAGVQVLQNDGAPGAGISIQIRGANSFLGGTEPLYVVDGIPFNADNSSATPNSLEPNEVQTINALSFLNPSDIESVEVLKDASATAIYGSRGANGVVLITTKKGKRGKDKVEVNVVNTLSQVTHQIHVLNAETYANYENEAFINADIYAGTNYQATGQLPYTGTVDPVTGIYKPAPSEFRNKSTNWQDVVFRKA